MSLSAHHDLAPQVAWDGALLETSAELFGAHDDDRHLLEELSTRNLETSGHYSPETGLRFANEELAKLAQETYDAATLKQLEALLTDKGTLTIPLKQGRVTVDGQPRDILFVAATEIDPNSPNHGDMSSMLYLRDHVQAANALMDLYLHDPRQYDDEGKVGHSLLISGLHVMSTPAQLARFDDVIARGEEAGQSDWPHISLHFNDLDGKHPNGWRNRQDTFQMLAYLTLDAVERGFLSVSELDESHKKFLGSIVPLLESVGFPTYENSGSWEEIAADRTSVMAVETALLHKIKTLTQTDLSCGFLRSEYDKARTKAHHLDTSFEQTLDALLQNGLHELGRRLPYESPEYDNDSVKYRTADAALAYVLLYDLPQLLAEAKVPIGDQQVPQTAEEIERLVLTQLATLDDPATNGIYRYGEDSYQRVNFHTNEVQLVTKAIKSRVQHEARFTGGEIDLDKKQALRSQLTPQGKLAAWTHPLGQLSAWAARRSLNETGETAEHYRRLSTNFLNRALSTVTGDNQWHAVLNGDGRYHLRRVPEYRLPECYIAYQTTAGRVFMTPSPHTPLNWSSAETKHALGLLRISTAQNR